MGTVDSQKNSQRKSSQRGSRTQSFGTPSRRGHDAGAFYGRKIYAGRDSESSVGGGGAVADSRKTATKDEQAVASREGVVLPAEAVDVIHCHDSRDMGHLADGSVHLMITSPPYNVGKDYDEDLSMGEYQALLREVLQETHRVLVDGGRACVNIANIGRKPYIPLSAHVARLAGECGFLMRGEIIWDKGASAGASCAWGSWQSAANPSLRDVHEYISVFSKAAYGRTNKGRDTIGRDEFMEYTKSIWRFPAASAKQAKHPAPFPLELPRRLIELYSFAGDVVLDPFMGGGTTALAALETGRHYVGYEVSREYVDIANGKIAAWHEQQNQGSLKL